MSIALRLKWLMCGARGLQDIQKYQNLEKRLLTMKVNESKERQGVHGINREHGTRKLLKVN